jgi:hypothetical protein
MNPDTALNSAAENFTGTVKGCGDYETSILD